MKTKMIFNLHQANLFIQHDCKVIGVGCGKRHKIYVLFEENPKFIEMMKRWDAREFLR